MILPFIFIKVEVKKKMVMIKITFDLMWPLMLFFLIFKILSKFIRSQLEDNIWFKNLLELLLVKGNVTSIWN